MKNRLLEFGLVAAGSTLIAHLPKPKEVVEFESGMEQHALTRMGNVYFIDGKPVTLKQALRWYARMERDSNGSFSHGSEMHRFMHACTQAMMGK